MSFARIFVLSLSAALVGGECHCKTSCATFPNNSCLSVWGQDICQRGWFGPYCQKENVALDRPTNQTGTYSNSKGRYPSSFAVDGRTATAFYNNQGLPNNCTHTAVSPSNHWTVFLNITASDRISHMRLYLRSEKLGRYKGMVITVDDVTCYDWPSPSGHDVSIINVTCRNPLPGNMVTISVPAILTLCEVQIFICSDSWFGDECAKQCNCHNETEICDKISGQCMSGCAAGYNGSDCRTACRNGTFGVNCSRMCGKCLGNDVCNRTTGNCSRGCEPGWMNDTCLQPCRDGYFGASCHSVCGKCLSGVACNKTTGLCPGECEAGWRNQTCLQPCMKGFFGTNCSSKCGRCRSNAVCNTTTGVCPGGCEAGWKKETCLKPCEDGMYGEECSTRCGHCKNDTFCNKTTGNCESGCQERYLIPLCLVYSEIGPAERSSPVAGAVGGAVAGLLVILLIIVIVIFKRRRQQQDRKPSPEIDNGLPVREQIEASELNDIPFEDKQSPVKDEDELFDKEDVKHVSDEDSSMYYNWVPPDMTLDQLQECVKEKKNILTLETQFKVIPYGLKHAHDVGKKPENKVKNRFAALYPYDNTRVVLKDGGDNYINANYICGFDDTNKYIATQGPNHITTGDLWRLIWQERVTTIVMLTQLVELDKKKCEQYWPEKYKSNQYGKFTVKNKGVTVRPDYTITHLLVKYSNSEERRVHHFHYTTWPDHGVPSAPALVTFWKKVKQDKRTGPLVVHCSAGVGRTGTFIALDYLVDEFESENKVNVFMCVTRMREARMNMVQTLSQYQFVHEAVLEALYSRGTMYTTSDFNRMFESNDTYTEQIEDTLKQQFTSLIKLRQELYGKDVSDASLPENVAKNRDQNILPGSKSRLYLSTPASGRNGFINAVVLPSVIRASMLVVTQTSLPDTVVDFWRLVADHDCFTIVCLDVSQDTKRMYPQKHKELQCHPFRVRLTDNKDTDDYMEGKLVLTNTKKQGTGDHITVFTLKSLDIMSQDTTSLLDLINRVGRVISSAEHKVLVHCHDGAHLSGVFCAALNVIGQLKMDNEVDIFLTIRELQCVRPQFVDSFEQYKLVYDVVREYNLSSSVYANM